MNRIQNLVDEELGSSLLLRAATAAADEERDSEHESAHCIFTPLHYERNYAYPLIVWLHGPNDDERQVTRVMPLVSMRNYVAVGPRGTMACRNGAGFQWSQTRSHIVRAEQRVFSAIAAARRWLNIAPSRIFLAGYGSGGTMAFRLALESPDTFAGVLSFGGPFPTTLRPLGRLNSVRGLKSFLAVGNESQDYPPSQVCETLRLFHTANMKLHLRQYPCGDDLLSNMLEDMDRWIMEQVVAPQPAAAAASSPRSGK